MAGAEDTNPHGDKVSSSSPTPTPTPSPAPDIEKIPIKKTGEIMLGFALAIIFLVIFCIIVHLLLKHHRQKYPNGKSKKKKTAKAKAKAKKDLEKGVIELHSVDRKVFEAEGTEVVLCELPEDAPPIHEMEAGEVHWPLPLSPLERTFTGTTGVTGTSTSEIQQSPMIVSPAEPWPERRLAVYWQSR